MIRVYAAIGILIGAGLLLGAIYQMGRSDEKAKVAARDNRELVEQIKDRSLIDDQVNRMSPADLCRQLDGVLVDGKCQ